MRSPFRSSFRVTQEFGINKEYYSKFSLAGHEGIDLVPTGASWAVHALADGVVVTDIDMASRGGAYGTYVTLWHENLGLATMYCHLSSNSVGYGERIFAEQKIGVMGNTGNTTGAHLHLNIFNVDKNGYRLNRDNGYLGGIDPLPFLSEGGDDMNMYKGLDLNNPESMKVAVDIWHEVMEDKLWIKKEELEKNYITKTAYEGLQARNEELSKLVDRLKQEMENMKKQPAGDPEAKGIDPIKEKLSRIEELVRSDPMVKISNILRV